MVAARWKRLADQLAPVPSIRVTPGTASAAASAASAASCSAAALGSGFGVDEVEARRRPSRAASCAGSARPHHGSSGASRAIATARSAIAAMVSGRVSLDETQACRWPTRTRRPRSTPSARSACSSAPMRTSIDRLSPATAIASAASAPAAFAASRSCAARLSRSAGEEEERAGMTAPGENVARYVGRVCRPETTGRGRAAASPGWSAAGRAQPSALTRTFAIQSGSLTVPFAPSPRLIASTTSCPAMTLPTTVYWPSRCGAGANMMKNWLLAEFGSIDRAMPTVPFSKGWAENSAGRSGMSEPPVPARREVAAVLAVGDVAGLGHEAVDDPVEDDAVVGAGAGELLDPGDVLGGDLGEELDLDRARVAAVDVDDEDVLRVLGEGAGGAGREAAARARKVRRIIRRPRRGRGPCGRGRRGARRG